MKHALSIKGITPKEIRELGDDFRGENGRGESLSFTNYYMQKNGRPFLGVSGEFHFSRMSDERWEDELIKMKLGGINVVTTYVFWISMSSCGSAPSPTARFATAVCLTGCTASRSRYGS